MRHTWMTFALAVVAACGGLSTARAGLQTGYAVLTVEHTDIGVGYDGGWDLHVHDETNDIEYEPDEALLYVAPEGQTTQPAAPEYAFLGAGAGNPVWVLPQLQDPALLFLGLATEEVAEDQLLGDVSLRLVAVRGSAGGKFSLWQSDIFGAPLVRMATSDGIDGGDQLVVPQGTHAHANFGFTATGCWEVDFVATAELVAGGSTTSDVTTYYFGVAEANCGAVPEPSAWALLAAGGAIFAATRRRSGGVPARS